MTPIPASSLEAAAAQSRRDREDPSYELFASLASSHSGHFRAQRAGVSTPPRYRQLQAPKVRNATGLAPAGTASMGTESSASVGAPIRAATAVSCAAIEAEDADRVLAEHRARLALGDRVERVAERELRDRHRRRRRRCTATCSRCAGSRSPTSAVTRSPRAPRARPRTGRGSSRRRTRWSRSTRWVASAPGRGARG